MPPVMASSTSEHSIPPRVLACVLCQKRKVKCQRSFPCANCVKSRAQCVPATLAPRRRKRKLPTRALLDRLREYEDLLRHNSITFEPFHQDLREKEAPGMESGDDSDGGHPETAEPDMPTPSTTVKSERSYEAKYVHFKMLVQDS